MVQDIEDRTALTPGTARRRERVRRLELALLQVKRDTLTDLRDASRIDGDGLTDRVTDPSHTGAQLTVAFGKEAGYGTPVGVRKLVGRSGSKDKDVLAAVADFDDDGWSDLVVLATGQKQGDDAIAPTVDELISGPFSASGRRQHTRPLDLGETRGIAVADYDHNAYPDLGYSPTQATASIRRRRASGTGTRDSPTAPPTRAGTASTRTRPMTRPRATCPAPACARSTRSAERPVARAELVLVPVREAVAPL